MRPRHGRIPRGGRPMAIPWEARGARPTAARASKGRPMASRMESRRQRGRGTHASPEMEPSTSPSCHTPATQPQRRTTNHHTTRRAIKNFPATTQHLVLRSLGEGGSSLILHRSTQPPPATHPPRGPRAGDQRSCWDEAGTILARGSPARGGERVVEARGRDGTSRHTTAKEDDQPTTQPSTREN